MTTTSSTSQSSWVVERGMRTVRPGPTRAVLGGTEKKGMGVMGTAGRDISRRWEV